MYYRLKTTPTNDKFVLTKTSHAFMQKNQTNKQPSTRSLSLIGSDSYTRSLRRSFARSKLLAFFNPDLTHFITFTYKQNQTSTTQALKDIKQFLKYQTNYYNQQTRKTEKLTEQFKKDKNTKSNPFKYIYVFEKQKRGAIHVHMVANGLFRTRKNKNGYDELYYWKHGFTSVLNIKTTDNNFKPYLYLFKYMGKAQRVGRSFIHVSRNFDKIQSVDYADYITKLQGASLLFKEDYEIYIEESKSRITKEYYQATPQNTARTQKEI